MDSGRAIRRAGADVVLPATATAVVLARHGETDDNAAMRFQGYRDPALNARGRDQAAALGEALALAAAVDAGDLVGGGAVRAGHHGIDGPVGPIREIWVSPYQRAQETAAIIAERLALPVRTDERIAESNVGDWAGLTYAEVQQADPAGFNAWVDGDPRHEFPGGESLLQVTERVQSALEDARACAPTVLLVCHGGVIRSALRAAGYPVREPGAAHNGEAIAL
ncbi:MAG: histidine phosphatase family protein [Solirubrobacteraceae bacterium]|nr:histidine phosphatase family protein [Solirubrobacteraceae bacterium]